MIRRDISGPMPFFTHLLCAALFPLLCCCGNSDGVQPEEELPSIESGSAARSVKERGPVRVTKEIKPEKARLSDELTLTLTIEAQQGVAVEPPPFGESLGPFIIRDFREPLPEVRGNVRVIKRSLILEPLETGTLSIYPITITFVDNRPEGDHKKHKIETEGIDVEISSALDTKIPSLAELAPPAPPKEMPVRGPAYGWWVLGGAAVAAGFAAAVVMLRKKRNPIPIEKRLTPQEIAFLEFQELIDSGVVDRDVKLFYVGLTGIVRRYIERTTGVCAPEQTTEEFLHEIARRESFVREERERLQRFLEAADLVKFARFEPGKEQIEESFDRAKEFIGFRKKEAA